MALPHPTAPTRARVGTVVGVGRRPLATAALQLHYRRRRTISGRRVARAVGGNEGLMLSRARPFRACAIERARAAHVFCGSPHPAGVRARVRQWKPTANVDDPSSWNGTVPCSNDRLVFPADVKAVVFIQRNHTLQEVRLPANGVLLFAEGASMVFSSAPDRRRGCTRQGRELAFSAGKPKSWFDPDNWCVGRDCADDSSPATYVDAEIVPCTSDDVIFPEGNTVSVDLHSNPQQIMVKSLSMRGVEYNTSGAFATYFNGDFGKNEFVTTEKGSRTKIAIGNSVCTDSSGCVCDNIHTYMEELVCASRRCESRLPCASPVKAEGNCCPSCGSLLDVTVDASFNMTYFRQALSAAIMQSGLVVDQARYAVTKVTSSGLQVLATLSRTAASSDDPAIKLGCYISGFIRTRTSELRLGVEDVRELNSDGLTCEKHPSHDAVTQAESTKNAVIGIMVGLAIVVVLGILIFIYRKSLYWKVRLLSNRLAAARVRFDGKTAELQTIENPVFDSVPLPFSGAANGRDKVTAVAFDARNQSLVGFENPLCPDQMVVDLAEGASTSSGDYKAAGNTAAPSFFGASPFGGASSLSAAGRGSRAAGNTGVGFDNPLASTQNAAHEASGAAPSNGSSSRRVADPQPRDPALDGQAEGKKQWWISKLRLPKLFANASSAGASASSTLATKSPYDEKGFSNPLYQSPTVETLSFAGSGLPYTPTEALHPPFAPSGPQQARVGASAQASMPSVRDGAEQLLDDDFLRGAVDRVTTSDTAELIL